MIGRVWAWIRGVWRAIVGDTHLTEETDMPTDKQQPPAQQPETGDDYPEQPNPQRAQTPEEQAKALQDAERRRDDKARKAQQGNQPQGGSDR